MLGLARTPLLDEGTPKRSNPGEEYLRTGGSVEKLRKAVGYDQNFVDSRRHTNQRTQDARIAARPTTQTHNLPDGERQDEISRLRTKRERLSGIQQKLETSTTRHAARITKALRYKHAPDVNYDDLMAKTDRPDKPTKRGQTHAEMRRVKKRELENAIGRPDFGRGGDNSKRLASRVTREKAHLGRVLNFSRRSGAATGGTHDQRAAPHGIFAMEFGKNKTGRDHFVKHLYKELPHEVAQHFRHETDEDGNHRVEAWHHDIHQGVQAHLKRLKECCEEFLFRTPLLVS